LEIRQAIACAADQLDKLTLPPAAAAS